MRRFLVYKPGGAGNDDRARLGFCKHPKLIKWMGRSCRYLYKHLQSDEVG
jgi:hypothetical protein